MRCNIPEAAEQRVDKRTKPRSGLRASLAGLVLVAAACSATADGGGIVSDDCVPHKSEYQLSDKKELKVGVSDITFKGEDIVRDYISIVRNGKELKISEVGVDSDDDEHSILVGEGLGEIYEEDGSRVQISTANGDNNKMVVTIVKTCPQK